MVESSPGLRIVLIGLAVAAVVAVLVAAGLLALLYRRLRNLRIPPGADLWTTLRAVPLALVVALDLLDLGLDVLSAPVVWWVLGRLRLSALREVATVQALVPFSGPVPVLTIGWVATRAFGLGRPPASADVLEGREVEPGRWEVPPRRGV